MKVYVIAHYDYDNTWHGPIFTTRDLAEAFASANDEIEEWEVLDRSPVKVRCYYATRHHRTGQIVTGSRVEWEFQAPSNEDGGSHTAWSVESARHARELLAQKEGRA